MGRTHRGIDPGRPGVPKFGRKLYNLRFPRSRRVAESPCLTPRRPQRSRGRRAALQVVSPPRMRLVAGAMRSRLSSSVCAPPVSPESFLTMTVQWSTLGVGPSLRIRKWPPNSSASLERAFTLGSQLAEARRSDATFGNACLAHSGRSFWLATTMVRKSHRLTMAVLQMEPKKSMLPSGHSQTRCAVSPSSPNSRVRRSALFRSRLRPRVLGPRVGFGRSPTK